MSDPRAIDQVKLCIMQGLSALVIARYGNIYRAVTPTKRSYRRLHALKHGVHDQFSIDWLIQLADEMGAKINITIE